jgi:hypothetical protein
LSILLLGSEAAQATAHATTSEKIEVYPFTAAATGLIEEISLETNGTANTGVTSVWLGVYAEGSPANAKPEGVMQEGKVSGAPAINSLITVTGLMIPVVSGKTYWLGVVANGAALHFNRNSVGSFRVSSFSVPQLVFDNNGWKTAETGGSPKFYAKGKAVGTERRGTYGVQNASNHAATWVGKKVLYERGSSVPGGETDLTEAGEATPAAISTGVGEQITAGFLFPSVILNVEKYLGEVNTTVFAEKATAIIKKVREDYPAAEVLFEIINEPWERGSTKKSSPVDYANIVKAVIEKVKAEGITAKILVSACGTYERIDGTGKGLGTFSNVNQGNGWVHDMFEAQPSLKAGGANEITAWVSHSYGRAQEDSGEVKGGIASAVALRESVIANAGGGYNSWYITEMGFANNGTAGGRNVANEAEQATCLKEYCEAAQCVMEAGWLKLINVYADGAGEAEWQVFGKTAGTVYGEWAEAHALLAPGPATPVLDTFNRTENPLANGWETFRGVAKGETNGSALVLPAATQIDGAMWPTVFSGHQQVYCEVLGIGAEWIELWCSGNGTESHGYSFEYSAKEKKFTLWRNPESKTTVAGTLVAGESMWLDYNEATGKVTGYTGSGGTWTERLSYTDPSPLTGGGKIAFAARCNTTGWKLDNFGGGGTTAPFVPPALKTPVMPIRTTVVSRGPVLRSSYR